MSPMLLDARLKQQPSRIFLLKSVCCCAPTNMIAKVRCKVKHELMRQEKGQAALFMESWSVGTKKRECLGYSVKTLNFFILVFCEEYCRTWLPVTQV